MNAEVIYLPGAGSAGLAFEPLQRLVPGRVIPIPDHDTVQAMASAIACEMEDRGGPRILVGASLGAMVALELYGRVRIDGWVLIAAGTGIRVDGSLFRMLEATPESAAGKLARAGLVDAEHDRDLLEIRVCDFEARGVATMANHFRALAAYEPAPIENPPPTFVIWGTRDRAVSFESHLELSTALAGALIPIDGAGHAPFLERPPEVARWIDDLAAIVSARELTGKGADA
ncbi:alpha/beta fold hydrolase [Actinomadura chibensis]|uniref:Alpha/beta hydrolase n=1 Tax=Actinomadura chibensis TaxID=392828 RepID=A0A5D0NW49_9ACTN|nr:alpha/beta hydrolase [Actinomadura chibensis]TYB48231.1 alpha/beta hydrolase [Actinomadura chibensis]